MSRIPFSAAELLGHPFARLESVIRVPTPWARAKSLIAAEVQRYGGIHRVGLGGVSRLFGAAGRAGIVRICCLPRNGAVLPAPHTSCAAVI